MNSFNMKIFRFFNKLADYFWKKALQQQKRKVYHGTNTEAKKKLPKGLQEAILKSQKKVRKKRKGKKIMPYHSGKGAHSKGMKKKKKNKK